MRTLRLSDPPLVPPCQGRVASGSLTPERQAVSGIGPSAVV